MGLDLMLFLLLGFEIFLAADAGSSLIFQQIDSCPSPCEKLTMGGNQLSSVIGNIEYGLFPSGLILSSALPFPFRSSYFATLDLEGWMWFEEIPICLPINIYYYDLSIAIRELV